ncbi:acyclic terpene utilization AtuA family protein (plasmid) [Rhodococcus globerulus]|uniref:acyclic terpene utilization AtuA family protein n=1 Tax=Rhodococcus globerulus TaxID=33008 RepID=UPI0039E99458
MILSPSEPTRVLVPVGMLGSGIDPEVIERGIGCGAHAIAVDAGSTDPGPYYLGDGKPRNNDEIIRRDLRLMILPALAAGIPVIVGSCGTSGLDSGVDATAALVEQILQEAGREATVARVYSQQDPKVLADRNAGGGIHPLRPEIPLDSELIAQCSNIVGVMGHEPLVAALSGGADIVLAGRTSDAAVIASVPLWYGKHAGASWHAGKIAECGALCTTDPRSGGVLISVDNHGFEVEPLSDSARCTPRTVAAHMLYENANPFELVEPTGVLDVRAASYSAVTDRKVRVVGSQFHQRPQATMKLEGATLVGHTAMIISGIRDPKLLNRIDEWDIMLREMVTGLASSIHLLEPHEFSVQTRLYGHNAVLGTRDRSNVPHEVGVVLTITAPTQHNAVALAQSAGKLMLHLPLPDMTSLPSFALRTSPSTISTGPLYEFSLNHVVDLAHPTELTRTAWSSR